MSSVSSTDPVRKKIPYPGKNKIFLNGHVITSPNVWWFLLTFTLLVGSMIFLIFAIFPYAIDSMIIWLIPYVIFVVLIPYFSFKTALTDPGILLRKTSPLDSIKADNPDEYDESGRIKARLLFHHLNDNFVIGKQVMVDDQLIMLKYCHTCELFRPPKASHCHYCDNCVEEFDHHCPWLSNCIGRRNYRSFVLFVFSVALAAIYTCIFMAVLFYRHYPNDLKTFSTESLTSGSFFFLFCLSCGLILGGLFCYHLMLISYDMTTAEHVKKSKPRKFSWPICRSNFYRVFFHPVPEVNIPWEMYTHHSNPKAQQFV